MTTESNINVAIIGSGYWGPNWIRTILGSDTANLRVVCDTNPNRLQFVTSTFSGLSTTNDFDSVIARSDIDAVVIATPPESHETLGIKALAAGKHVLIEKPMTVSVDQARNLVNAAETYERTLAVGHIFAYHPAVTAMNKTLSAGDIGELKYVNSTRMNMPPPTTRFSVIWDLAVHDVSIALTLNKSAPVNVSASGRNFRDGELFDAATITIEFDDGTISWHHVGWLSAQKTRRFFVGCQSGSMEFDDTLGEDRLKVYGEGIDSRKQGGGDSAATLAYSLGDVVKPELDPASPLEIELEKFVSAINGQTSPIADGIQGLKTVRVLAAAEQSLRQSGAAINLETLN